MATNNRLVVVGRSPASVDGITRLLEGAGYIVTSTTNDGVAIDMVGSSGYAALLIGADVSQADRRYVSTQARNRDPGLFVLAITSPRSVLTQLSQALGPRA